ncbi:MAG: DUF1499 domain-containing protein [Lewinella sp.]|nr:DUF1499 domain-containing protein [Lewinella sp.]
MAPCPDSPNCVSSQAEEASKKLPPLRFQGEPAVALAALKKLVTGLPRTQLLSEEPHYLHFAFTTWPIPFVDDVEFLLEPAAGLIHFRSASRIGYSDLGVNWRRMQKISRYWAALASAANQ